MESGGTGDKLGPWTAGSCYKNPNAPSHYVGGHWGSEDLYACYGAQSSTNFDWPFTPDWLSCGTIGGAGKRWGSCEWWREWCANDFWSTQSIDGDILTLFDLANEESDEDPGKAAEQANLFYKLQGLIEREIDRLVGGSTVAREKSKVHAGGISGLASNAQFCRARIPSDYGSGMCGGNVYPERCKPETFADDSKGFYPVAYYDQWAADARGDLVVAAYQFALNNPEGAAAFGQAADDFTSQADNIGTTDELTDAGASDPYADTQTTENETEDTTSDPDLNLAAAPFPTWAAVAGLGIVALAFAAKRWI